MGLPDLIFMIILSVVLLLHGDFMSTVLRETQCLPPLRFNMELDGLKCGLDMTQCIHFTFIVWICFYNDLCLVHDVLILYMHLRSEFCITH
jgi:hypothetical protein